MLPRVTTRRLEPSLPALHEYETHAGSVREALPLIYAERLTLRYKDAVRKASSVLGRRAEDQSRRRSCSTWCSTTPGRAARKLRMWAIAAANSSLENGFRMSSRTGSSMKIGRAHV